MSEHSIDSVDSVHNLNPSSVLGTESSAPLIEPSRRSSLRSPNNNSRDCRRVSFLETVNVRTIPISDSPDGASTSRSHSVDDIDTLTQEVFNKLSKRAKDAPIPSLDDLHLSINTDDDIDTAPSNSVLPSTSRGSPRSSRLPPTRTAGTFIDLPEPSRFDEKYIEMDLYMRIHYPKYYHFLKSYMITGAVGSQDYRCQELQFRKAIVSCSKYPLEFFSDIERSLTYYERQATGTNNRR